MKRKCKKKKDTTPAPEPQLVIEDTHYRKVTIQVEPYRTCVDYYGILGTSNVGAVLTRHRDEDTVIMKVERPVSYELLRNAVDALGSSGF